MNWVVNGSSAKIIKIIKLFYVQIHFVNILQYEEEEENQPIYFLRVSVLFGMENALRKAKNGQRKISWKM
jgi:hypothetical protein